ncbi:MAG: peptidase [Pirellulaceae bacterium]
MIQPDRRQFMATSAATTLAVAASPYVLTASRTGNRPLVFGQDEYQYEFVHDWAQLPERYSWQTTHNVAVDSAGLVYVIHEGREEQPDHPSIFVFDETGQFVMAFGNQFQGGGHGLEVHREGSEEFLYVAAYQQVKSIAKLTLDGETVWQRFAPTESGVYAENEDTDRQKVWGRDRFMPTNFAFLPDGDFLLADGYGSYYIHRYDSDGNWKSHFGGPGEDPGTFDTPHGLWIDERQDEPVLVVTDRANHRLQVLSLDGKHRRTIDGFGLPANVDRRSGLLLVPELLGRVSLLNEGFETIAVLGDDRQRVEADNEFSIRRNEDAWLAGKFVHPHDACFDGDGNIYVAEWVADGRVSKLRRVR